MIGTGGTLLVVARRAARVLAAARRAHRLPRGRAARARDALRRARPSCSTSRASSCAARCSPLLMLAFLRLEKLRVHDAPAAGVAAVAVGDRWRSSPPRRSTGASRGGTTRAGRSRRPARRPSASAGTTTTARSTGRATAASCCASRRASRPTGRRATSTCSTGARGAATRASAGERADASSCPTAPSRRALDPAHRGHAAQPALGDVRHRRDHDGGRRRGRLPDRRRHLQLDRARSGRGDSYAADVYTPRPTERQLRAAGDRLRRTGCAATSALFCPSRCRAGRRRRRQPPGARARDLPALGHGRRPEAERFGELLGHRRSRCSPSPSSRATWALAQELRAGAETPFEYVERVEAYLDDGFAYSETPPRAAAHARRLPVRRAGSASASSSRAPRRCCCGWAGSRRAWRPASRPGSFDEKQKEYVVRDLDAHSWVEAWFPDYGWVTRDPTPASAPPRSQPGDGRRRAGRRRDAQGAPDLGGERLSDLESGRALAQEDGRTGSRSRIVGRRGARRAGRRRPSCSSGAAAAGCPPPAQRPMAEFERALRRARFDGGAGHDAVGARARVRRLAGRGRLRARAARAALLGPAGRADRRAAPRPARRARPRRGNAARVVGAAAAADLTRTALARDAPRPVRLRRDARHGHDRSASAARSPPPAVSPLPPRAWARTARHRSTTVRSDRGWRRAPRDRVGPEGSPSMTRRFSLLVDDRPETLLRVTGLCLRRRADVVALRYGRSAPPRLGAARPRARRRRAPRARARRAARRARRGPRRGRAAASA